MEFSLWPKIPSLKNYLLEFPLSELDSPLHLSVKIHGTNGAIGTDGKNVWCQSRTRILSVDRDNYGFAKWVERRKEYILNKYQELNCQGEILLFGEFAGKGIQKNVGVSNLDPFFYLFPGQLDFHSIEERIYPALEVDSSFKYPGLNRANFVVQSLEEIVAKIDQKCPFYESLTGLVGVGEGIVIFNNPPTRPLFKIKGNSHRLKDDLPKQQGTESNLSDKIVRDISHGTTERFSQIHQNISCGERLLQPCEIPTYIQAVIADIESEEGPIEPRARKIIGNNAVTFLKSKLQEGEGIR